ncbi:unnamed protein product [Schistosoma turkestanicum]|nr:unnamed protein product [Schistosoma turkestanicum]
MYSHSQIEMKHPSQSVKYLSSDFSMNRKHPASTKLISSMNRTKLIDNTNWRNSVNNNSLLNLQSTSSKTLLFEARKNPHHHNDETIFHIPYTCHSIANISELLKNNVVNHFEHTNVMSYKDYLRVKLNHVSSSINDQIDEQISLDETSQILYTKDPNKKYYSLQNLIIPCNKSINNLEHHQTHSLLLSKYARHSSLMTIPLQTNIHCLKQFYESYSTYVIVCEYPVNLSIRYIDYNQLPNINLFEYNNLWHPIGWGYLIAVANRNKQLPNSFESIALILCQPITFKQLWIGYIMLPYKFNNNSNITNTSSPINNNYDLVQYHIEQIHKTFFNDQLITTSHCIVTEIRKHTYSPTQMKQQRKLKFYSTLKSLLQRLFIKSSNSKSNIYYRKQIVPRHNTVCLNNNENLKYCLCKIESMQSDITEEIHQQSIRFFSELDKLLSNAIVSIDIIQPLLFLQMTEV